MLEKLDTNYNNGKKCSSCEKIVPRINIFYHRPWNKRQKPIHERGIVFWLCGECSKNSDRSIHKIIYASIKRNIESKFKKLKFRISHLVSNVIWLTNPDSGIRFNSNGCYYHSTHKKELMRKTKEEVGLYVKKQCVKANLFRKLKEFASDFEEMDKSVSKFLKKL